MKSTMRGTAGIPAIAGKLNSLSKVDQTNPDFNSSRSSDIVSASIPAVLFLRIYIYRELPNSSKTVSIGIAKPNPSAPLIIMVLTP